MSQEEQRARLIWQEQHAAMERERAAQERREVEELHRREQQRWQAEQQRWQAEQERRAREVEEAARQRAREWDLLRAQENEERLREYTRAREQATQAQQAHEAETAWTPNYGTFPPGNSWDQQALAPAYLEPNPQREATHLAEEEFRYRINQVLTEQQAQEWQYRAEQQQREQESATEQRLQWEYRTGQERVQAEQAPARLENLPIVGSEGWAALATALAHDPGLQGTAIALMQELRAREDTALHEAELVQRLADEEQRRHHERQALALEARRAEWEDRAAKNRSEQEYWASLLPGTPDYARAFGDSATFAAEMGLAPEWQPPPPDQDRLQAIEYQQYAPSAPNQPAHQPPFSARPLRAGRPDTQPADRAQEADRHRAEEKELERQAILGQLPTTRDLRLRQEQDRRTRERQSNETAPVQGTEQQAQEQREREERARRLDQRLQEMAVPENFWGLTAEETQQRTGQRAEAIRAARFQEHQEREQEAEQAMWEKEDELRTLRQAHLTLAAEIEHKAELAREEVDRLNRTLARNRDPGVARRLKAMIEHWERQEAGHREEARMLLERAENEELPQEPPQAPT